MVQVFEPDQMMKLWMEKWLMLLAEQHLPHHLVYLEVYRHHRDRQPLEDQVYINSRQNLILLPNDGRFSIEFTGINGAVLSPG